MVKITYKYDLNCPKCSKPLILRKRWANDAHFFGCTGYPNCDIVIPIQESHEDQEKKKDLRMCVKCFTVDRSKNFNSFYGSKEGDLLFCETCMRKINFNMMDHSYFMKNEWVKRNDNTCPQCKEEINIVDASILHHVKYDELCAFIANEPTDKDTL